MGWEMADPDAPQATGRPSGSGGGSGQGATPVPPVINVNVPQQQAPKQKKKHGCLFKLLILIVVAAVAFGAWQAWQGIQTWKLNSETYAWPTSGIATLLPQPESANGSISSNTDSAFDATIRKTNAAAYSDYVAACKEKGFDLDASSTSSKYTAYTDDGYLLTLSFDSSDELMGITVESPMKMSEIAWPTTGLGALVPAPASTKGAIKDDSATHFEAFVGGMTKEAFDTYVESCSAAGFNVDYKRTNSDYYNTYRAENAEGDKVELTYKGGNIVEVDVQAHKEAAAAETPATTETTETAEPAADVAATEPVAETVTEAAAQDPNVVTPSFKEMMDSYEAFMNQYCDFMEKYTADGAMDDPLAAASMLADYASMMQQYADWAEKIDAIDEETLTPADDAYYIEVNARVAARLILVSAS